MNSIVQAIRSNKEYFEDFITRSTYHSNRIEGSTISYAETYALLFNDDSFKVTADSREIYEAINHKYALNYLFNHIDEPLTEKLIKDLAICINKNINEISGYRTEQVYIRAAEHIPPAPKQVPQAMMYFVHNYENTAYDSIYEKLSDTHIQFERIHPFSDGNGRTGRLLINYGLIRENELPLVIDADSRTEYFGLLAEQNTKDLASFFERMHQVEKGRWERFLS